MRSSAFIAQSLPRNCERGRESRSMLPVCIWVILCVQFHRTVPQTHVRFTALSALDQGDVVAISRGARAPGPTRFTARCTSTTVGFRHSCGTARVVLVSRGSEARKELGSLWEPYFAKS